MVFYMREIKISGSIRVTEDLASRLQSRGLLLSSGDCSDDMILYIQECLARDDSRCSILAEKPNIDYPKISAKTDSKLNNSTEVDAKDIEDTDIPKAKPAPKVKPLGSLVPTDALAELRQGMDMLYQGGQT